jgi:hypothetical protein
MSDLYDDLEPGSDTWSRVHPHPEDRAVELLPCAVVAAVDWVKLLRRGEMPMIRLVRQNRKLE